MQDKSDAQYSSSPLRVIAKSFRLAGWISFWIQVVVGVVAGGILTFAIISQRNATSNNPGTGLGIFLAFSGLAALTVSIYLSFRYTRLGRRLDSSNSNNRPRKIETVNVLQLGVIVNLAGMLLTILGAQAIVGALLTKSLTLPQTTGGVITQLDPSKIIQPLDIFVVQANTNTLLGHYAGLVASMWLLNRVNRPQ
jgi:Protein of unknown function (DUF3611)